MFELSDVEEEIVYICLASWLSQGSRFGEPSWNDIARDLAERLEASEEARNRSE